MSFYIPHIPSASPDTYTLSATTQVISSDSYVSTLAIVAGSVATLADGTVAGQLKKLAVKTDTTGDATITLTSARSSSEDVLELDSAGSYALLMWVKADSSDNANTTHGGSYWKVLEIGQITDFYEYSDDLS